MKKIVLISLFFFYASFYSYSTVDFRKNTNQKRGAGKKIILDYGFLKSSFPENMKNDRNIFFGLNIAKGVYYKIVDPGSESIIKGGYLTKGLNIIEISSSIVENDKTGKLLLYLKNENQLIQKKIHLYIDKKESIKNDPVLDETDTVRDKRMHEISVTEKVPGIPVNIGPAGSVNPVTGDNSALAGGIPILPLIFSLGKKIFSKRKRERKKPIHLNKKAVFFILKKVNNEKSSPQYQRISIEISDQDKSG